MRANKFPENSKLCEALAMKKHAAPLNLAEYLGMHSKYSASETALVRHVRGLLDRYAQENADSGIGSAKTYSLQKMARASRT